MSQRTLQKKKEMSNADYERIADNISTMIDQTGYTIDEIAEVVNEMVEEWKQ